MKKTLAALEAFRSRVYLHNYHRTFLFIWSYLEMTMLFNDRVIGFNELLKSNDPRQAAASFQMPGNAVSFLISLAFFSPDQNRSKT